MIEHRERKSRGYLKNTACCGMINSFTVLTCQSFRNFWPIRLLLMKSSLIVPHLNTCCICKEVNLLNLKTSGESKCPGYLNFLWNYSQMHDSEVRWFTSKWMLGHRQKKRGGDNTSSPISYLIFFIQASQEILYFRQYLLYFPCHMSWMRNTSRQIVIAMLLHFIYTDCI